MSVSAETGVLIAEENLLCEECPIQRVADWMVLDLTIDDVFIDVTEGDEGIRTFVLSRHVKTHLLSIHNALFLHQVHECVLPIAKRRKRESY